MDGCFLLGRGGARKGPHRLCRVQVVVADRVAPRRMRPDERSVHKEGRVAVAIEPVDDLAAHEGGLRELGREPRRRPGRAVRVRAWEPLHGLVELVRVGRHVNAACREPATPGRAPPFPRVENEGAESWKDSLVAEQPRVAGCDGARIDRRVRVPEEHGVVALLPRQKGHVGEAGVEGSAIQERAVPVLVRTRVETRPRRPARRRVGPVIGEQHPTRRQGVKRRRLHDRVIECRQAVPTPLVERDEEHVRAHRACRHSCATQPP